MNQNTDQKPMPNPAPKAINGSGGGMSSELSRFVLNRMGASIGNTDGELEILHIIPCGTKVTVGRDIEATVRQVTIGPRGIQYQVAWWDGSTRKSEWLDQDEITPEAHVPQKIGFIR